MLKVCQQPGESVQGTIDVRPNAKNNRDLDIIIEYKVEGELSDGKTERIEYKMYAAALCRCKRADPNISGRDEGIRIGRDGFDRFHGSDSTFATESRYAAFAVLAKMLSKDGPSSPNWSSAAM